MISDKIKIFTQKLPGTDEDLKIGYIYFWFFNNSYLPANIHYKLLKMKVLLVSNEAIIYSNWSEVFVWELEKFKEDLTDMYRSIGAKKSIEFRSDQSQFRLELTSNQTGQISIKIIYIAWEGNLGSLEFEDEIDQSYLPSIINDLDKVLKFQLL